MIRRYFDLKPDIYHILDQSNRFTNKYKFRWVQCHYEIDFEHLKEDQIVNHIVNIGVLTTKTGLYTTLSQFDKSSESQNYQLNFKQFYPLTYKLETSSDRLSQIENTFMKNNSKGMWIYKPSFENQGKGIQIVWDVDEFKQQFRKIKDIHKESKDEFRLPRIAQQDQKMRAKSQNYLVKSHSKKQVTEQSKGLKKNNKKQEIKFFKKGIIQKYIENPLLINRKKFDIRCFVLLALTEPYLVLFQHGYLRISLNEYKTDDHNERCAHLTNAAIQKKHPDFKMYKEDTIWNMMQFKKYLVEEMDFSESQAYNCFEQIKKICTFTHIAGEKKIQKNINQFELFGLDFMFDCHLNPYLIEINSNPALFTDTQNQLDIIPPIVYQTIDVINDIYSDRNRINERLVSKDIDFKNFEVLINAATDYRYL